MWLLIILLEPNNNYTKDWRHTIMDDDDDGVMCINVSFYWCKDDEMVVIMSNCVDYIFLDIHVIQKRREQFDGGGIN